MRLHLGVAALRVDRGGWLHVHGNAPRKERDLWAEHIVSLVRSLLTEPVMLSGWTVVCTHIEKVKAYAPRVDHLIVITVDVPARLAISPPISSFIRVVPPLSALLTAPGS